VRRALHLRLAGLVVPSGLALGACSPSPAAPDAGPTGCTYGPLGDPTQPAQVQVIALGPDMTAVPIEDGDPVALAFPPQGGRVIFAGVRATNVDPCAVQLEGVVRDETTHQVRLDSRTINLKPSGDGWGESDPTDISTFANIPVCPNEWSKTNLYGTEYELAITLTERSGRMETQSLKVIPACSDPATAAVCLCICQGGYVLGQSCAADGGVDGGDAGDGGEGSDGGQ
jgi:hypothetical protein